MKRPLLWILGLGLHLQTVAAGPDFQKDILPILEERCLDCHDGETRKGGVALDTYHAAHQPSDNGEKLFVPGSPKDSLLLQLVSSTDLKHRMPPKGKPLSADQIETLRTWISEGALWPDDGWRPKKHWAYEAPKLPPVPATKPEAGRNAIDAFIHEQLAARKIQPNPDAEPATQLRRVFLDLTGLPPTVEQADRFLAAPSDAAYERFVDELLASPAFGERWARHWLDLARYADSEGYQRDELRSMWPWRDWVIQALNADMPYDRFTIEQLAGDLLPNATLSQKIATGFQRNTPLNLEAGTDPNEDHYKKVVDRVNTFGAVWLGSTIGCAQCHNHKYDPVSIGEYYRLFAFFNQTPMESRRLSGSAGALRYSGSDLTIPGDSANSHKSRELETALQGAMADLGDHLRPKCTGIVSDPIRLHQLPMETQEVLEMAEPDRNLEEYELLVSSLFGKDPKAKELLGRARAAKKVFAPWAPPTTRVMQEMETVRATFIAKRGDFLANGESVLPGVPAILPPLSEGAPVDRLGLARWLFQKDHPLTARVAVNRLWSELFGRGLVSTVEEFGAQGEAPSHPALLDWLAVTFVEKDHWSLKQTLRRMVLSSTYRRSAVVSEAAQNQDAPNQWLWRHPGHRLDAETIRDNALAFSGLLSTKMGGEPVHPPQPEGIWRKAAGKGPGNYVVSTGEDRYRRGIYTVWKRNGHYPAFATFDAPDRGTCNLQRSRSNTPLQALALMNDQAYVEMTKALASRMLKEFTGSVGERLERAFRTVLTRHPSAEEQSSLQRVFDTAAATTDGQMGGYFDVAAILLNLHETIHRG